MTRHDAILTTAATWGGQRHEYATDELAETATERFGHAVSINRLADDRGVRYVVECSTQRGDTGSMRMHSIACAYGIPVHTDELTG